MEVVIAGKDSAITTLETQLAHTRQCSLEYERMSEDLSRWITEKEEGLDDKEEVMQKQVQCVEKENDTMTNEMDTVLGEKAVQRTFAFSVYQH